MTGGAVTLRVAVETPQHSGLAQPLSYRSEVPLAPGTLVRVPLGKRDVPGIVWPPDNGGSDPDAGDDAPPASALKAVREVLGGVPPLPARWLDLVAFAARYYQRGVGELALAVLPPALRALDDRLSRRRIEAMEKKARAGRAEPRRPTGVGADAEPPAPSDEQAAALAAIEALDRDAPGSVALLHGATGSGKTEVYLRAAERVLASGRQVLLLVPEINLTPQLEARVAARFGGGATPRRIVSLHSGLTPAQRLNHWLAAQLGLADLVLGTRLAVFTPLARLGLVVVDEEHDASYKQQEGARYSARDLAVYRGRLEGATVVLGSATPSLESWHHAGSGRYRLVSMPSRIGGGALPAVRVVDMQREAAPRNERGLVSASAASALAPRLLDALKARIARGEQSLVLLNRRGYAPVLRCGACGWQSDCPHCSAWRVFHKLDRTLRCHHCGLSQPVPRACPECGNADIAPVGRGTERLEEQLAALLPGARIARIDADSTRRRGALEASLGAVHAGEVDVLVGTQMVAKGHDFRRITLVAAASPDSALFSSDFRAPERLFALLMQAAGRAGRDARSAAGSEMWVQTWHPHHPLFAALVRHDYVAFAAEQLEERRMAGLPPFSASRAAARRRAHARGGAAFPRRGGGARPGAARGGERHLLPAGAAGGGPRGRRGAGADAGRVGVAAGAAAPARRLAAAAAHARRRAARQRTAHPALGGGRGSAGDLRGRRSGRPAARDGLEGARETHPCGACGPRAGGRDVARRGSSFLARQRTTKGEPGVAHPRSCGVPRGARARTVAPPLPRAPGREPRPGEGAAPCAGAALPAGRATRRGTIVPDGRPVPGAREPGARPRGARSPHSTPGAPEPALARSACSGSGASVPGGSPLAGRAALRACGREVRPAAHLLSLLRQGK